MNTVPTTIVESLNKHISELCSFSIGKLNNKNHCAHYVSHIMGYEGNGATCKNLTLKDKKLPYHGAMIRVNELFLLCSKTGTLTEKPATMKECLIFATIKSNMQQTGNRLFMRNGPTKHVGILRNNLVWHYSNLQNRVACDHLDVFIAKFKHTYKTVGTTVEFYYGNLL